ncbi:Hypp5861 [Branchiostoma lanceolatum]|uniref:Hypp5861 protein n=1 Tax=Branchiostoma lanceolatum TaxID=7740 RepID=A0A8J9VS29_BRALA|nr:Hypp5861 [Branchiostoma lanceolatum]
MACRVHSCCGCCSVRVGAVIVGVLYLIFAVAGDIVLAVIDIVGVFTATPPSNGITQATPSNNITNVTEANSTDNSSPWTKISIATWVELGVDALFLIICVLLIIGAAKNNKVLCMIWLVAAGLWTAFMAGEAVYLTVERYLAMDSLDALWQIFLDTLIVKWGAVVLWLFMLIAGAVVVSSHVADIRDDKETPLIADRERSYPT